MSGVDANAMLGEFWAVICGCTQVALAPERFGK
jgi:hypothetical protein